MDLLYTRRFDGFCLVSSDSDFTRLAARIREEGLTVYGFGEQKTPSPFVSACDKFIYTEILRADAAKASVEPPTPEKLAAAAAQVEEGAARPARTIDKGEAIVPAGAGGLHRQDSRRPDRGGRLDPARHARAEHQQLRPAFDPRLYGCRKLSELIAGQPKRFDLESRGSSATGGKDLYVRLRKPAKH